MADVEVEPVAAKMEGLEVEKVASAPMEKYSQRVLVKTILGREDGGVGLLGQTIIVGGWVKTGRSSANVSFVELNDGSCPANLQVVVEPHIEGASHVTLTGTSILVEGFLKEPPTEELKLKQKVELSVVKFIHIGTVDSKNYPISKTRLKLETLREYLHLRPRTNTISAIARVRNALAFASHTFFNQNKFLYVHTPILTTSDCEGAGEMFQVTTLLNDAEKRKQEIPPTLMVMPGESQPEALAKAPKLIAGIPHREDGKIDYTADFFARQAFLTVSGQLQVEGYACALGSVYTFGPTFRAENSHTTRHLAEFWMIEPEIAFADLKDDMNCAEDYIKFLCQWLLDHCLDDMEFLAKMYDKTAVERLRMVASTPFVRITYTEAVETLQKVKKKKFEKKVEWGIDLASEHERYLTEEIYKKPVIVYNYPKDIKAFYMRLNDDGKTVAAMDVLVPKVGELVGGSQREERLDVLIQRLEEMKLPKEPYEWYLDLRRFGTVKHAGFGLGFERMILFATGIENIRDVIPFPRYPGRADL
ncbi:asparaginyl-tRNA synthetase [Marchantia polymorpha subsp. ruderalis]|uniref:asparagine--tRNA ligase n=2 Tax=Marchantia polymorpha TaxID=3197 RepID=A0AAF6AME4_MARPO|nr:hypothetical protein MARPO_0043s0090 [Marchantia polymorpha]BBM97614.1 hypothetical protein Mp_1g06990 [Marchantia polymorpha subsp. ruderalis]|eukprot:PTQ39854.1 hypothetical protein MARPO_0043s0090 [Marchantia polymorpha]